MSLHSANKIITKSPEVIKVQSKQPPGEKNSSKQPANKKFNLFIKHRADPEIFDFFKIVAATSAGVQKYVLNVKAISPNKQQTHQLIFINKSAAMAFKLRINRCNLGKISKKFTKEDFKFLNDAQETWEKINNTSDTQDMSFE